MPATHAHEGKQEGKDAAPCQRMYIEPLCDTIPHLLPALCMKTAVLYHALWLFYIGIEKYPLHTVRAALALFSVRAFAPAKLYQCGAYPDAVGFF